jgi:hypothetical protein
VVERSEWSARWPITRLIEALADDQVWFEDELPRAVESSDYIAFEFPDVPRGAKALFDFRK